MYIFLIWTGNTAIVIYGPQVRLHPGGLVGLQLLPITSPSCRCRPCCCCFCCLLLLLRRAKHATALSHPTPHSTNTDTRTHQSENLQLQQPL